MGRDASPVLDHYPPRPGAFPSPPPLAAPTHAPPAPASVGSTAAPRPAPPALAPASPPPKGLLSLERPFNVDEFSQLLGETTIRVAVPKEDLAEVLRRVTDFMGFGIYVYSVTVRPGPDEMLRKFEVELQRLDYSPAAKKWTPFEEKGVSDSPFGPGEGRPGST